MTDSLPGNPLRAALGRALEFALARALALDPAMGEALRPLEGREMAFAVQSPPLALRLRVEGGGLRVGPDRGAEPDLSVKATLGGLLGQVLPGREAGALPVGQVRISGDAELARRVQQLAHRYAPDFEEAFARVFGDVLGVQIARALHRALDAGQRGARTLARDTADYLTEESRDLVARAEVDTFLDDVDDLRDRVERLARRVEQLQRRERPA